MKKIYEILGQALNNGDVGVEIEVEGENLVHSEDPRWNTTEDGSLRGEAKEYVLAKPLPVSKVKSALSSLHKELMDGGSKLDFSFRTSVHVHVNCQQMTLNQYLNFIYTYLLLEEPLMTFCGRSRKGNRFCLRLQDAEGVLYYIKTLFEAGEGGFGVINQENVRYAALNIYSTLKFGSLEFRGMEGNLDVERLTAWCEILVRIREFAYGMGTPKDVFNLYTEGSPDVFLARVVGKKYAKLLAYEGVVRDVQTSFSLSLDLPFSFVDKSRDAPNKPIAGRKPLFAARGEAFKIFMDEAVNMALPPLLRHPMEGEEEQEDGDNDEGDEE